MGKSRNKPFRKVSKTQIINTINKKELLVEIEFDIGNKKYKKYEFTIWSDRKLAT